MFSNQAFKKELSNHGFAKISRRAQHDARLNSSDRDLLAELNGMANYGKPKSIASKHPEGPVRMIAKGWGYFSQVNTFRGVKFCPNTIARCLKNLSMCGYIEYEATWDGTVFKCLDYDAVMLRKSGEVLDSLSYNQQYLINPHSKRPPPVRFFGSKGAGPPDWETSKRQMAAFESAKVATVIPEDALKLLNMWRRK